MLFRGWQKTSLIEYPGKVSTVLFTGGCNFRCPFCYNRELVLAPGKLPEITEKEVLGFLEKRKGLYQGVIVTGGEPTMEKGLPDFLRIVREMGLSPAVETNGTDHGMLKRLVKEKLVDFVAMDIKAPLTWDKYRIAAAIEDRDLFGNVLKSVKLLMESGVDYEFRTTIVPGLHKKGDILEIAGQIRGARKYVLQQFTPKDTTLDSGFKKLKSYPDSFLTDLKDMISGNFEKCEVRNLQG